MGVMESNTSVLYNYLNENNRVYMFDGFRCPFPQDKKRMFFMDKGTKDDFDIDWGITIHENAQDTKACARIARQRYMHLEWLSPWAFNMECYPREWGYKDASEKQLEYFFSQRDIFKKYFAEADVKSLGSMHFVDYMSYLFEMDLSDVPIKYPAIDLDLLLMASISKKDIYSHTGVSPDRSITTISRLVPHKNINTIAKALAKWNQPVTWDLIGEGTELEEITEIISGSKINLQSHGRQEGFKKIAYLRNSLCIFGWNGTPPGEALLSGSYSLVMDDRVMREYYDDSVTYYDSVDDLVEKIDYYWNRPEESEELAYDGSNKIVKNQLKINTTEQAAKFILGLLDGAEK